MKVIIGLGNPGAQYNDTRHNIGFMVLDKLEKEMVKGVAPVWQKDDKRNVLTVRIGDLMLVKPQTFMNKSGFAVRALVDFYKLQSSDLWIVHDDIDLPLGKIKIREKGASAGHNGVQSIIDQLGTDAFIRFRLGIGRDTKHSNVISFVLSRFHQDEAGDLKKLVKHSVEAIRFALDRGIARVMNQYN